MLDDIDFWAAREIERALREFRASDGGPGALAAAIEIVGAAVNGEWSALGEAKMAWSEIEGCDGCAYAEPLADIAAAARGVLAVPLPGRRRRAVLRDALERADRAVED